MKKATIWSPSRTSPRAGGNTGRLLHADRFDVVSIRIITHGLFSRAANQSGLRK
jgi:hypothetical protein